MSGDSLTWASSAALFAAAIGAWHLCAPLKAVARLYLRFAATLMAALAASAPLGIADTAALLLLPLASGALMLAALARFARPLNSFIASTVLVGALAGGLAGLVAGAALAALLPVMLAGLAIIAAGLNRMAVMAALSGAALISGALAAVAQGVGSGLMLFSAAALIGLSAKSAFPVQQAGASLRPRGIARVGETRRLALNHPAGHRLAQDLRHK